MTTTAQITNYAPDEDQDRPVVGGSWLAGHTIASVTAAVFDRKTGLAVAVSSTATIAGADGNTWYYDTANISGVTLETVANSQLRIELTPDGAATDQSKRYVDLNVNGAYKPIALAAYNGEVALVNGGAAGTAYPIGTPSDPSGNIADALTISTNTNLRTITLAGIGVVIAVAVTNKRFVSRGATGNTFTSWSGAGAVATGCAFEGMFVLWSGGAVFGNNCNFERCILSNPAGGLVTLITDSLILGTILVRTNTFVGRCFPFAGGTVICDCTNLGAGPAGFPAWSGNLTITNLTTAGTVAIDSLGGTITIDASCTAGTITISGIANVIDNSAGASVDSSNVLPLAQGVRDAMKLTPTVGAPAADSIDLELDSILADTAAIEPLTTANLDATVSSRSSQSTQDIIDGIVDSILVDTGTDIPTRFTGIEGAGFVTGTDSLEASQAERAALQADTDDIQTRLPAALVGGRMDSDVGNLQAGTITATEAPNLDAAVSSRATQTSVDTIDGIVDSILVDTGTDIPARFDGVEGAGFVTGTDSLEAIRDRGDAAWLTAFGFSTHSAADVDTVLSAAHGAGSWVGTSAQDWSTGEREQIRDALGVDGTKTAATGGDVQDIRDDVVELNDTKITTARADNLDEITAVRLAELDAVNLPADVDAILVDTGTTLPAEHVVLASGIAAVQADTDDIQTRLPAALVAGRMDSDVAVIQTDAVDADALAADAVTEIQSGLATAANVLDASRWVHGAGGYNGTILSAVFVARKNGVPLLTTTAATIEVFNAAGTSLIGPIAATGPTGEGFWRVSVTPSPVLVLDAGSYIEIAISDPGGDFPGGIPIARQS